MFVKGERKKRNPALIMTVGALAAVGVASIVRGGKRIVKATADKMRSLVHTSED